MVLRYIKMKVAGLTWLALTGVLAPLLLMQGRRVRHTTPKLPEPDGPREGCLGFGRPVSLLIVGDSAAAGVGATHQQLALSGNLLATLARAHSTTWRLLARTGDSSGDLILALTRQPAEQFDWVVVSIGVNDVTGLTRSANWVRNLHVLEQLLVSRYRASHILFSSLPPMHLFPALPQPLRWWLGQRAIKLNRLLADFCHESQVSHIVSIPYQTDLALMADDGFHPGTEAYKIWADRIYSTMLAVDQQVSN